MAAAAGITNVPKRCRRSFGLLFEITTTIHLKKLKLKTMLNIHYFASVRESLQRSEEQMELPETVKTVADLITHLAGNDVAFQQLQSSGNGLLVAVNQTVVDTSYTLSEDDEVAFFPPMTGG